MAEKRLDHPEIGAARQQMGGEGMAQHMRRDAGGRQAGLQRQRLDQHEEGLAGHVVARSAGRKQMSGLWPALGLEFRRLVVQTTEPGFDRRAGGGRERHHPLFAALAAHEDHRRIAAHRRLRQRDQFRDPHPCGVEQFDQRGVAGAFGGAAAMGAGGVDQSRHLVYAQGLRQLLRLAGAADAQGGIVRAPALGEGETVKLADRRQPPGAGGFRQALGLAEHEPCFDLAAPETGKVVALRRRPTGEILQVAAVAETGVLGGARLGGDRVEEGGDPAISRGGGHRPSRAVLGSSVPARCAARRSPASPCAEATGRG
ncbi:hypothetical protein XINFAN_03400 [Pseudogemmobacter humi]|uniref:Uncharacterized protein n=1 Tax=Pseudogemmobacter humi TaxID=2483812 RepID=A0A3P5XCR6_9RHOB|nr:hypothetical protein XINFAN_03400 [Pseudogemmobacter humi]